MNYIFQKIKQLILAIKNKRVTAASLMEMLVYVLIVIAVTMVARHTYHFLVDKMIYTQAEVMQMSNNTQATTLLGFTIQNHHGKITITNPNQPTRAAQIQNQLDPANDTE